jgi:hypothetical protein
VLLKAARMLQPFIHSNRDQMMPNSAKIRRIFVTADRRPLVIQNYLARPFLARRTTNNSPKTCPVRSIRIWSAMLVLDKSTSSANGACGQHARRQDRNQTYPQASELGKEPGRDRGGKIQWMGWRRRSTNSSLISQQRSSLFPTRPVIPSRFYDHRSVDKLHAYEVGESGPTCCDPNGRFFYAEQLRLALALGHRQPRAADLATPERRTTP